VAGVGLGMKAPVRRVLILLPTRRAKRERRHRGIRPVVRHLANNGKTRAAVGAVNKRITVAAVIRVKQLLTARLAGGGIRHDVGIHLPGAAVLNHEIVRQRFPAVRPTGHLVDLRQRRALGVQRRNEIRFSARRPQPDQHPGAVVEHATFHAKTVGDLPDIRAKPHPLHLAFNADFNAITIR